jgi:hypothetical protein
MAAVGSNDPVLLDLSQYLTLCTSKPTLPACTSTPKTELQGGDSSLSGKRDFVRSESQAQGISTAEMKYEVDSSSWGTLSGKRSESRFSVDSSRGCSFCF